MVARPSKPLQPQPDPARDLGSGGVGEAHQLCRVSVMGMMPGTIGTSMPDRRASSTKRKYASGLKKYCVIAECAPAFTLVAKAW